MYNVCLSSFGKEASRTRCIMYVSPQLGRRFSRWFLEQISLELSLQMEKRCFCSFLEQNSLELDFNLPPLQIDRNIIRMIFYSIINLTDYHLDHNLYVMLNTLIFLSTLKHYLSQNTNSYL